MSGDTAFGEGYEIKSAKKRKQRVKPCERCGRNLGQGNALKASQVGDRELRICSSCTTARGANAQSIMERCADAERRIIR